MAIPNLTVARMITVRLGRGSSACVSVCAWHFIEKRDRNTERVPFRALVNEIKDDIVLQLLRLNWKVFLEVEEEDISTLLNGIMKNRYSSLFFVWVAVWLWLHGYKG